MARMLITTVGTSLLTNRDDRPWSWKRGEALPEKSVVDKWLLDADPVKASAETNTLQAIEVKASDHVRLLHSDTKEGRFCSERLQYFLIHADAVRCPSHHVTGCSVTSLGYAATNFAQKGLKGLVAKAIEALEDANRRNLKPVFCATGGFKAEIAFLNLLGALLEVEVYYIHEQFREIVRLPRLPLRWDAQWVLQHRGFFEWIREELRTITEAQSRLKANPNLQPLIEEEDGYVSLNPAGDLLFEAAKAQSPLAPPLMWPDPALRQPHDKNKVSKEEHHRPRDWEQFVNRLCHIGCVRQIRYDKNVSGSVKVYVIDADKGIIGAQYRVADKMLPLRVETTASGKEQTQLVADYIQRQF